MMTPAHGPPPQDFGELVGGIAHDLNNQLAVMINFSAVLAGELRNIERASPDERWVSVHEDLGEIQLAGDRAARLSHQLLWASQREGAFDPLSTALDEHELDPHKPG